MEYNVGDKVRIKSEDWYKQMLSIPNKLVWQNKLTNDFVGIWCGSHIFKESMFGFLGKTMTIQEVGIDFYLMEEDTCGYEFNDEMIEGLAEETKPKFKVGDKIISDVFSTKNDKGWKVIDVERTGYRLISVNNSDLICDMDFKNEHYYKLVEEEVGLVDNLSSRWDNEFNLPEGYIFKDENGNEILTSKIILEKINTLKIQSDNMETETHRGYYTTEPETTNESKKVAWFTFWGNDFADKVELDLSNRELIQEDGKWFVVKKKKEYPKTYEECCEIVKVEKKHTLEGEIIRKNNYKIDLLESFQKLLICRDAYWKIAGEEMGLGKPWEPDYDSGVNKFGIICMNGVVQESNPTTNWERHLKKNLDFPSAEMRDAFKKNFDPDIEFCKELL